MRPPQAKAGAAVRAMSASTPAAAAAARRIERFIVDLPWFRPWRRSCDPRWAVLVGVQTPGSGVRFPASRLVVRGRDLPYAALSARTARHSPDDPPRFDANGGI